MRRLRELIPPLLDGHASLADTDRSYAGFVFSCGTHRPAITVAGGRSGTYLASDSIPAVLLIDCSLFLGLPRCCGLALLLLFLVLTLLQVPLLLALYLPELLLLPGEPVLRLARLRLLLRMAVPCCCLQAVVTAVLQRLLCSPNQVVLLSRHTSCLRKSRLTKSNPSTIPFGASQPGRGP